MNVTDMTLEGFFLADYQRLRDENEELKAKLGEVVTVPDEYGCFDLKRTFDAVKVDVESSYRLSDPDYGYTSDMLEEALKMVGDKFWRWCTTKKSGKSYYSSWPISIEYHKFQYTLRFRETRCDITLVTDGQEGDTLYLIDNDAQGKDCLRHYQSADRLGFIKEIAMGIVKDNIREALPKLREKEAKAEEE